MYMLYMCLIWKHFFSIVQQELKSLIILLYTQTSILWTILHQSNILYLYIFHNVPHEHEQYHYCFQIFASSSIIASPWLLQWIRELSYIRRKISQLNYYPYSRWLKSKCLELQTPSSIPVHHHPEYRGQQWNWSHTVSTSIVTFFSTQPNTTSSLGF